MGGIISIEKLCIARGRKDEVDPITGKSLEHEIPDYHFSPSLAAKTILENMTLALNDNQVNIPEPIIKPTIYYWDGKRWLANGESVIEDVIDRSIGDLGYAKGYTELFRRLRKQTKVLKFDADLEIINLKNGRYNWKTKEFIEHSANDPYPSLIQYPIEYDPTAIYPNKIDLIIEKLTPNKLYQIALKEWAAYCFYRAYLIKKALMMYGPSGTSKSIFDELLVNMLGAENCNAVPLDRITNNIFAVAGLKDKSRNNCGETPATEIKAFNNFKALTGRDQINSDVKFKDAVKFWNFAKIEFMLNEVFKTKDKTDAFYDRLLIILFLHKFTDEEKVQDVELLKAIKDPKELSGFFNECMELLPALIDRKAFSYNPSAYEIEKLFNQLSEPIKEFVDRFVIQYSDDENKKEGKEYLYSWFEVFSTLNNTKADREEFYKYIKNLDCVKMYGGNKNNCKKRYGGKTPMAWPNISFNLEEFNKFGNLKR
jgi:P4 family phage/plasmid primase-like protien